MLRCAACRSELRASDFSAAQRKKVRLGTGRCAACVEANKEVPAALTLPIGADAKLVGLDRCQELNDAVVTVMSTVDGERYEVRTKRPDSTGKIRTLVVHPSSIVALSLCAVCATLAPKATSLDCDVCGKLYCSEECQRRDRDNGHDRECRHRSVLLEAFRDRSRRLGDLPRTSSLVAGELLDRRLTCAFLIADLRGQRHPVLLLSFTRREGKEPLCRCDTVEQSEVRPLFVRMRLAAGESGIINTERIMERNRVFGDSTALCFEMAQGCSLEMREYSGGLVFQTTKSIKSFDEIWAQYRTDLHWFGMRGHIRSMEPSERAQQIAELVREGIGGYAYRRMLWPTGRPAPPLAERQQWVRRLETLGWLDTPENTRETVRQTGKRLPDEYDQVEADLAAVRCRRRRSGGASDEARVIAKAGALRHDGEQAMNRGRAAVALDRYQQAIELLQFASEPAALTSLVRSMCLRAEAFCTMGSVSQALEDVEDACDILSHRSLEAHSHAALVAELERVRRRAVDVEAAAEIEREERQRLEARAVAAQEAAQEARVAARRAEAQRRREAAETRRARRAELRARAEATAPRASTSEGGSDDAQAATAVPAEDEVEECCICMEAGEMPQCKPCGRHSLHVACVMAWRQQCRSRDREPTCPTCREPI
ncbi:hypothetical protein EMIHUDRAFT_111515 [Emiliania huxleyi CCMP1516]|uniref:RING-type domain-containing protein n=3 Tax=Emiliania huxleyi TaxID=2903 RepID=A0A0D3KDJ6_EMIH1|nr:hypothetical protein EMIHUDRAFT_111515 [Emiliania huxleyi CCMP1516]EOD33831.1 hypothetical protein EMIHUDRAFT_111515 [Emiliania huxleyi CCMP1516]|eukprot:XP_005786260.1 hypothetical protein EMIHUDRAFT_111515 [Emiliania huxleyi CCMP1516]